MKKLLLTLTGIIATALIFAGGVFASQWLSFTGDDTIQQSQNDVDEIMQILRDVNNDKLTAEQALEELQELNPKGLAKQNKELREQVKQLENDNEQLVTQLEQKQTELDGVAQERDTYKQERDALQQQVNENNEYVKHLEQELIRANEQAKTIGNKTNEAVEEARTYK